ncbi:GGDEF domain-containing protein [Rhodoferax sp.]|uniref:GGDEF domain-containing protein n=1 Tax=Rhodoferax sp. TaxID=50421 RepID=UPI0025E866AD|nr:GGDEF domain-containing protein [Rhodoferax sp.]
MLLDLPTLLVIATANVGVVSLALLVIIGTGASAATRCVQIALAALLLGGVAAITAGTVWTSVLAPLALLFFSLGLWLLHRALGSWLGHRTRPPTNRKRPRKPPRPGVYYGLDYRLSERCLRLLLVATPLGYLLGSASPAFQWGWSHLCLVTMLVLAAAATLFPMRHMGRAWRWMLCGCLTGLAVVLLVRGLVGGWGGAALLPFADMAMALAVNLAFVACMVALLAAWRDEAKARLHNLAMTDGLTGLLNRRGWLERAEGMFANAMRYQQPLTLMMLDIDHFKRVNDTYGHEVGDTALKLFARLLRDSRRTGDLVGRLGGEEFCIVLANTHRSASIGFDLRLRTMLHQTAEKELGFPLDYSAGVGVLKDGDSTLPGLIARADAALYEAKKAGRGQLVQSDGGAGLTVI